MTARSQIFIADLLRSVEALRIESVETAREVARMLSLETWHEIVSPRRAVVAPADRDVPPVAPVELAVIPAAPAPAESTASDRVADPASAHVTIRRLASPGPPIRPAWLATVTPLERAVRAASAPPEPLLDPRQERALLGALSACLGNDGSLHVERLVAALAQATIPLELPLQPTWGTRRGLQLLVDDGPGMAPFRGDVERVIARLGALMPDDRLDRLAFEGTPLRGCRAPRRRGIRPWKPPEGGGAVLLLTDLGIAEADPPSARGTPGEWLAFADEAQTAGIQLRSLVPYPASRWPAALAGRLYPVPWDRRTTVALVRRTVSAAAHQTRA